MRRAALALLVAGLWPAGALAQDEGRFFVDRAEEEKELDETDVSGSLTSTSFAHREVSRAGEPILVGNAAPENASPLDRVFTDLRAQLSARHISGGAWDFRADARARYVPGVCRSIEEDLANLEDLLVLYEPCRRVQSGTFGGNEYEVREFYFKREGDSTDASFGRQFVLELAATKFDGLKVENRRSAEWKYLAFAGLYPQRISRDVRDDYPLAVDPITMEETRILPVVGGAGAAYRFEKFYGSFGIVGIVPRAIDRPEFGGTGANEVPRIFGTASGYWRQSHKTDIHHYLVVDATGAGGAGITNLTLGLNHRLTPAFRTFATVSQVDTETLNVHAQTQLRDPAVNPDVVQNHVEVLRLASRSARAGFNAAFRRNRFDVGMNVAVRERPDIQFDMAQLVILDDKARAADLSISLVDRKSWKGTRLGASVTRSIIIGDRSPNRGEFLVGRLDAARGFANGRGELEADVTYVTSSDERRGQNCIQADPLSCFGTAAVQSLSVGTLVFYRFKPNWFVVGSAHLGRQRLTTTQLVANVVTPVPQPPLLLATLFARLAYRF